MTVLTGESLRQKVLHTDYEEVGRKVSAAIRLKQQNGTYVHSKISEEGRKALSEGKLGPLNPNWKGGRFRNLIAMKTLVRVGVIKECSICSAPAKQYQEGKGRGCGLDVHHIDGDNTNDSMDNLIVTCESCHYSYHEMGYNFHKEAK